MLSHSRGACWILAQNGGVINLVTGTTSKAGNASSFRVEFYMMHSWCQVWDESDMGELSIMCCQAAKLPKCWTWENPSVWDEVIDKQNKLAVFQPGYPQSTSPWWAVSIARLLLPSRFKGWQSLPQLRRVGLWKSTVINEGGSSHSKTLAHVL